MKHSDYSPSSSHRWLNCPASIKLSKGMAKKKSNAADEGTKSHEKVCEYLKHVAFGRATLPCLSAEEQACVDYVESTKADYYAKEGKGKKEMMLEWELSLDSVIFGTCDCIIDEELNTLEIIDFKFGEVEVSPVYNTQLMMYALMYGRSYGLELYEEIKLTIVQPKNFEPIKSWVCEEKNLLELEDAILKIRRTRKCEPKKGEWCNWCPAIVKCPAYVELANEMAVEEFKKCPVDICLDQAVKVIKYKKMIEKYIEACEAYVMDKLNSGEVIEGVALGEGRPRREWNDEKDVVDTLFPILGEDIYDKKLKSVSQIEKICSKEMKQTIIQKLQIKKAGNAKIITI